MKCNSASGRHTWLFIGNFMKVKVTKKMGQFGLRGKYKCKHCPATKTGNSL